MKISSQPAQPLEPVPALPIITAPELSLTGRLRLPEMQQHLVDGRPVIGVSAAVPPAAEPILQSGRYSESTRYNWKGLLGQSLLFLGIEQAFRFGTQPWTRSQLKGPFFEDWFTSVSHLRGWRDGDPFLTNYIGHPMQGGVSGFIYIQNSPKQSRLVFGASKAYWKSRAQAMLFAAIYSTQFELGPLGESALGNVGLEPRPSSPHPQAYVDLVITPTVGMIWMVGEDALDRYFIAKLENHFSWRAPRMFLRGFFNPTRSFANLMRFKQPWYRDTRHGDATW